jgi:hypothetical protein
LIENEIFRRVEPEGRTIGEYLRSEILPKFDIEIICGVRESEYDDIQKRQILMKPLGFCH